MNSESSDKDDQQNTDKGPIVNQ
jgi:hypothetical protein